MKLVTGYPGTNEIRSAMERGEVDGLCGLSYSSLRSRHAQELRDKKIHVLVQVYLTRNPELAYIPFVGDFATPDQANILRLLLEPQAMARPFAAPPGVPADRLSALRVAFNLTMMDTDFIVDAKKMDLDVNPMKGEDISNLISGLYALPKGVGHEARRAMGLN